MTIRVTIFNSLITRMKQHRYYQILFVFSFLCVSIFGIGTATKAQVNAPITAVETQPGVFDFSTTYDGGPNALYVWTFGDGNQGNGNPVTHAYSFANAYVVYLEVYDTTQS